MNKHNRIYTSIEAFLADKSQLPYPCICKITDEGDTLVFFRHEQPSTPDALFTVGASRFLLDYSVMNGQALIV